MKKLMWILVAVMPMICLAGADVVVTNPERVAIKQTDEWTKLKEHLDAYAADYITMTNKIALVTDAKSQTALNKAVNVIEDQHKLIKDLKKIIAILVGE